MAALLLITKSTTKKKKLWKSSAHPAQANTIEDY